VVTIQSGSALTISDANANNVFGISEDRAQLSGTCSKKQLVEGGSVESKLGGYFNAACFTSPPIIGADGIGTAFGNSGTGIVDGPGQANLDLALSKTAIVNWPIEKSSVQFRAEFFNMLNHPQFANPDTNFTSPTSGVISSTIRFLRRSVRGEYQIGGPTMCASAPSHRYHAMPPRRTEIAIGHEPPIEPWLPRN